jgi:magnesium and cobalt transporter
MEGDQNIHGKNPKNLKNNNYLIAPLNFISNLFSSKKTKHSFLSIISHLLEDYQKEGIISIEEKKIFKNMTSFGDKKISSIMTPRSDIVAIKHNASLEEVKKMIVENGYSRVPVFKENFDDIIGFIHSKDLVKFLCRDKENNDFEILLVPGSMKLMDVMLRMKTARVHIAIVLDEFGGVDGFVTIENIVEEIVGDIEDEHDIPSDNSFFRIKKIAHNNFQFGGRVEIKKIEEIFDIQISKEDDEFETVGGFAMSLFKGVPEAGEEIKTENLSLKIIDADARSVKIVEISIND